MSFKDLLKDKELRKDIILDYGENPRNLRKKNIKALIKKGYKVAETKSASCIDHVTVYALVQKNKVVDIKFGGDGYAACQICASSTDLIASKLINKNLKDALNFIDNYLKMINHEKFDDSELDELLVFDEIWKQTNRINCAKTGVITIRKALEQYVK